MLPSRPVSVSAKASGDLALRRVELTMLRITASMFFTRWFSFAAAGLLPRSQSCELTALLEVGPIPRRSSRARAKLSNIPTHYDAIFRQKAADLVRKPGPFNDLPLAMRNPL